MKVTRVACDNPDCGAVAEPEMLKPYAPPYGWLALKGHFQGTGPNIEVEVCSTSCLTPAIKHKLESYT